MPFQKNYLVHDLGLEVVKLALKLWQHFLFGNRCEIFTDHQSLKYLFTQLDLDLRQQRCMKTISDYDYGIYYTPGKANIMADAHHKSYCKTTWLIKLTPAR